MRAQLGDLTGKIHLGHNGLWSWQIAMERPRQDCRSRPQAGVLGQDYLSRQKAFAGSGDAANTKRYSHGPDGGCHCVDQPVRQWLKHKGIGELQMQVVEPDVNLIDTVNLDDSTQRLHRPDRFDQKIHFGAPAHEPGEHGYVRNPMEHWQHEHIGAQPNGPVYLARRPLIHRVQPHHKFGLRSGPPDRSDILETVATDDGIEVALPGYLSIDLQIDEQAVHAAGDGKRSRCRGIRDKEEAHRVYGPPLCEVLDTCKGGQWQCPERGSTRCETINSGSVFAVIRRWLTILALMSGLTIPAILPEASAALCIGLGLVGLGLAWKERSDTSELHSAPALLPLFACGLLFVSSLATASSPASFLGLLYFIPLYLVGPILVVLRGGGQDLRIESVSTMALAGSLAAVFLALFERSIGGEQAGSAVNNPIHFASLALCLGFVALAGLHSGNRAVRIAALLGPVAGLAAVVLADTRGPLLAGCSMGVVAALVAASQFVSRRNALRLVAGMAAVCIVAAGLAWWLGVIDRIPVVGDLLSYLRTGVLPDGSSEQRLLMYGSGLQAWLASPWFGYGFTDIVGSAARFSPEPSHFPTYDHLHNDVIDFAVAAGVLGVLAYILFIGALPLATLGGKPSPGARAAVLIALPLTMGYLIMGLTNAVVGVIAQTVLLAMVTAIVRRLARQDQSP